MSTNITIRLAPVLGPTFCRMCPPTAPFSSEVLPSPSRGLGMGYMEVCPLRSSNRPRVFYFRSACAENGLFRRSMSWHHDSSP